MNNYPLGIEESNEEVVMLGVTAEGLLGDFEVGSDPLPGVDAAMQALEGKLKLGAAERTREVEVALLSLLLKAPAKSFLLAALLDVLKLCQEKGLLPESYTFNHFERFLNQESGLSDLENRVVRGKICGKFLPREDYQVFFPVGGGRVHAGSHYVTAHAPPDIDTAVASFWGWVDAFAARVAENLHIWNLPGGLPAPSIQRAFAPFFGASLFEVLPRSSKALDIQAIDLAQQEGLELKTGEVATRDLDHQRTRKLIALIDSEGFYLGSWRTSDVEGFRLVAVLVGQLFQWLSSTLAIQLASLFAQPVVRRGDLNTFFKGLLAMKLAGATPLRELGEGQRQLLERALQEALDLSKGLESTVEELAGTVEGVTCLLQELESSPLFDEKGLLIEDRPALFAQIGKVIATLSRALEAHRVSFDHLSCAVGIKHRVFGQALQYIPGRASHAEIKEAMGDHHFLVVAEPAEGERLIPLGVVEGSDLNRKLLGTVSLRDFCNRDEVKIPEYLEIISVIDHHRTHLQTSSFPCAILGDAGSCNVLVAEQAFALNDRYGSVLPPMDGEGAGAMRAKHRRLTREIAVCGRGPHYAHPKREFAEYLSFLYAILDDTDLLDRVTERDVMCVAQLLNRLKSLSIGHDIEVVDFDDLPRDSEFAKVAAKRLLQNRDLYSLYEKVFEQRKGEVERDLLMCARGEPCEVFADTKEQKGCARVGQTKIFADNYPLFAEHAQRIRTSWLNRANTIYRDQPKLNLHLQMLSTMADAQEVYGEKSTDYPHRDELWIWVPQTEEGRMRLAGYLSLFKKAPEFQQADLEIELVGEDVRELEKLFSYHFKEVTVLRAEGSGNFTIIRYPAGAINSRKTSITPYLPG